MKKIGLLCALLLTSLTISGCGHHSYNLNKLRSEHARLLKEAKSQKNKHHKKHNSGKATKKDGQSNKSRPKNNQGNKQSSSQHQSANESTKNSHEPSIYDDPKVQDNLRRGLTVFGTRPRSSFKSDADFQRYNAWHQGYNYDPSTNTYTEMNQQELNDMRQQMNQNAGQNFK